MLNIEIITCQPELLIGPFNHSIVNRAKEKGLVNIKVNNLRDYSTNKHKKIDDYAFGGEAGMVLQIEPVDNCINHLKKKSQFDHIIYMSPDGEPLNQKICNQFSILNNIIILCGHYKGIDERIRKYIITKEISIGDYVLTGGELPACVFVDSIVRLIPGVLNDETSALSDSFQDNLISPPIYSRPRKYKKWSVPGVLLSGDQKKIENWKRKQSIERTKKRRPKLIKKEKNE